MESGGEPNQALVAGYEDLRRQTLDQNPFQQGLGMALLLRKGMVAWMKAWLESAPPVLANCDAPVNTDTIVANDHRNEVVAILAAMAFSHWQEQRV